MRIHSFRHLAGGALIALAVVPVVATAKPKPPPKPPRPEITLRTGTEKGALRRGEIKIAVDAKRAKRVTVTAVFTVDGYPSDYVFNLGPQRKSISDGDAQIVFPLSPRQKEVLDFAIKSCHGANLAIKAKTEKRTGSLQAGLKMPKDC